MKLEELNFDFLAKEFGKMDEDTTEFFDKVAEECEELSEQIENLYWWGDLEDKDWITQCLCDEALDVLQASASLVAHLVHVGMMTEEDINSWKIKLKNRKKKYLKEE